VRALGLELQVLLRWTRWICENGDETVAMRMAADGVFGGSGATTSP
jgi:hypothetical protein